MEADFSGYATKANLRCSDGRTIAPDAFKHQDTMRVPLVWQHGHNDPTNVLGHAILENREDGVYCYGYFNQTEAAKHTKAMVQHGDVNSLSIYATKLVEKAISHGKTVMHGMIREVSLVITGANPGARIDQVQIAHGDGDGSWLETLEDEAFIYSGLEIKHSDDDEYDSDEEDVVATHAEQSKTVKDVFDSMSEDQKNVVYFLIGKAMESGTAKHSDEDESNPAIRHAFESMNEDQRTVAFFLVGEALEHAADSDSYDDDEDEFEDDEDEVPSKNTATHANTQEGSSMTHNVFESHGTAKSGSTLSHADTEAIFRDGQRLGSLKEAVERYAVNSSELKHGIEDIDILFPDAKALTTTPEFFKRRTEWVDVVLSGTRHTPFARIKTLWADLTMDEARAKGYIKGNLKKEEFFRVLKRVTTPQTVYKKQKLDRDDVIDITDFDVVAWLKGEMRLMLDEEIARAVLIGDGRSLGDEDKINPDNIRPIAYDDDLYVTKLYSNLQGDTAAEDVIDALTLNRRHYRGSGNPTLFTSEAFLAQLLLIKDGFGRRLYPTVAELASVLRVSNIVAVEIMDEPQVDVLAVMVNLSDYTIGADKGGAVSLFDDFDIDYNQLKYLIETRCSGALTKLKSALVVMKVESNDVLVDPVAPTWDDEDKTVTVASGPTGIVYKNKTTNQTLSSTTPVTLSAGDELTVQAVPSSGYYLASNTADEFLFTYERGRVGTF